MGATGSTRAVGAEVAALAAAQLLAAAAATELAAAIGFALGRSLSAWVLAFACAAALATAALATRRLGPRACAYATALSALAFTAGMLLAGSTYDVSWDGQAYQQSGVIAIAEGWNPFGPPLPVAEPYTTPFWVNHYAKGPWVRAAAILLATGHIEPAKAWNFALATAAALACAAALLRVRALPAPLALAGAVLAALNPVFPPQMFTFYVDGQLASVVTAMVAMIALTTEVGGAVPLVGLGSAFLLLPGTKFTGAAYAAAFAMLAAVAVLARAREQARGAAVAVAIGLAAGVVVTGWNPYVTNLVRDGHPLHPVAGKKSFDVTLGQAPADFLARSRLEKLAISAFSASRHRKDVMPTLKWPFTWRGDETTVFQHPDARFGGFGPLFSGALVLSALAFIATLRGSRRIAGIAGGIAAALLATVVMNPEPWWARYVPQLWLVPLVLALAAFTAPGRIARVTALLTMATLAVDGALVTANAAHRVRKKSAAVAAQLEELAREPAAIVVQYGFESNRQRLREAGVPFREADQLQCDDPETLAHSRTLFCRSSGAKTPPVQSR